MSKEAVGQNRAVLGSSDYWDRLNRSSYIGTAMQRTSEPEYFEAVKRIGQRAASAIDVIYDDLQKNKKTIRNISFSDRNALSRQVQALSDVCSLSATSSGHSTECLFLLHQSDFSNNSISWFNESDVRSAINQIKNNPDFFASECLSIVRKAADWGIESAADNDKRKAKFLENVSQRKGRDFLRHVLEVYQDEQDTSVPVGSNGAAIGSSDYLQRIERDVFLSDLSMTYSARFGAPSYTALLRDSLDSIAHTMEQDLLRNERENNYITDETASILKKAGQDLSRCGVSVSIDSTVDKLAWFVGGDPAKIRKLQGKLNEMHIGEHLTEDGVYGKKTLHAWLTFLNNLENGTVPTLCRIDLLQNSQTGITIGSTTNGAKAGLNNALKIGEHPFIHIDPPHGGGKGVYRGVKQSINYNHINIDQVPDSNALYDFIRARYNHYPLTDTAYDILKDLENTGKKVRIAGKVLLVAGIALDALELGLAVDSDLKDADRKLGKTTASTAASIGGRWTGAAAGAKAGAALGAMTGPAAPIAIPILSIAGGIGGSFAGDYLAKWVVDITYVED